MNKQFIVAEHNKKKRIAFYNYIHNNFDFKDEFDGNVIRNSFPFVVDFNDNTLWISTSITCCACAAQRKRIISIEEFKRQMQERSI